MICPKCGRRFEGNWCPICGTRLERENGEVNFPGSVQNNEYDYSYIHSGSDTRKKLKIALAIICPIAVGIIVIVSLFASGIIGGNEKPEKAAVSSAEEIEKENIKKLTEKAQKSMQIGDYESAEALYKQIAYDDASNDEAVTVYKILYNYNKAFDFADKKDYSEARRFFNKIPSEYHDYDVAGDVESLEDDIDEGERAYKTFGEIKAFMKDEDYDNAQKCIDIIDETKLTYDDADTLDEYRSEIENAQIIGSDGSEDN